MRTKHAIMIAATFLGACSKAREPTRSATTVVTVAAPLPSNSVPAATTPGCDAPYPTAGARYVETREEVQRFPEGTQSSFMISVDDALPTRRGIEKRFASSRTIEITREKGGVVVEAMLLNDRSGQPMPLDRERDPLVFFAVEGPFDQHAALPEDVQESLKDVISGLVEAHDPPRVEVVYGGTRDERWGTAAIFELRVEAVTGEAATCHGLSQDYRLEGELVLRAADRAFVEMQLEGTDLMEETVCSADGSRRNLVRRVRARIAFRIARDCFKTHVNARQ